MSGCSILKDGHSTIEEYGRDLDQLGEGDRVGVLRTSTGALHFFVNGLDQGQAAASIPAKVYAVIDMYGKCAQVSIVDDTNRDVCKLLQISIFEIILIFIGNESYTQSKSIKDKQYLFVCHLFLY